MGFYLGGFKLKDEYNEYYKISDREAFNDMQRIRKDRKDWLKAWRTHAERLGFDDTRIYRDHSCLGFMQSSFGGFAISFDKIHTVDDSVYKLTSVDKWNKLNIYQYRKGNKKEYAKFKEFSDSMGLSFNLNKIGECLFPSYGSNNYPIGTIIWDASDHFLVRVVWFGRSKSETEMHPSLIRIKESEYLALQGK